MHFHEMCWKMFKECTLYKPFRGQYNIENEGEETARFMHTHNNYLSTYLHYLGTTRDIKLRGIRGDDNRRARHCTRAHISLVLYLVYPLDAHTMIMSRTTAMTTPMMIINLRFCHQYFLFRRLALTKIV